MDSYSNEKRQEDDNGECSIEENHQSASSSLFLDPNNPNAPKENDVLLGRGKPFHNFPGNQRMLRIVAKFKAEYFAKPREQKRLFVETALDAVLKGGTRFLRRTPETQESSRYQWEEVDRGTASEKVWHVLRARPEIPRPGDGRGRDPNPAGLETAEPQWQSLPFMTSFGQQPQQQPLPQQQIPSPFASVPQAPANTSQSNTSPQTMALIRLYMKALTHHLSNVSAAATVLTMLTGQTAESSALASNSMDQNLLATQIATASQNATQALNQMNEMSSQAGMFDLNSGGIQMINNALGISTRQGGDVSTNRQPAQAMHSYHHQEQPQQPQQQQAISNPPVEQNQNPDRLLREYIVASQQSIQSQQQQQQQQQYQQAIPNPPVEQNQILGTLLREYISASQQPTQSQQQQQQQQQLQQQQQHGAVSEREQPNPENATRATRKLDDKTNYSDQSK